MNSSRRVMVDLWRKMCAAFSVGRVPYAGSLLLPRQKSAGLIRFQIVEDLLSR